MNEPKPTHEDVERARDFLGSDWSNVDALALEFASIRAEEREACAALASKFGGLGGSIADMIRARGES